LYVLPSSVGNGNDEARSGTRVDPSMPPTCLNATRPSLVRLGIANVYDSYEIDGSIVCSPRRPEYTVSVSPRCVTPRARTETRTEPPARATPSGRLPSRTVLTTRLASASIRVRLAPTSFATQTVCDSRAMSLGPAPVRITAVTLLVFGSTRLTVPSR
jgi:hypothetical protein